MVLLLGCMNCKTGAEGEKQEIKPLPVVWQAFLPFFVTANLINLISEILSIPIFTFEEKLSFIEVYTNSALLAGVITEDEHDKIIVVIRERKSEYKELVLWYRWGKMEQEEQG